MFVKNRTFSLHSLVKLDISIVRRTNANSSPELERHLYVVHPKTNFCTWAAPLRVEIEMIFICAVESKFISWLLIDIELETILSASFK